jgi:adenylate cyclase
VRELSLMFTDVRNFTSISEQLSATELTQFINDLLTPLTDIIHKNRGTIDKYMGDAIMAFWNAPLDDAEHAVHACRAAVEMAAAMEELNARWRAEAEEDGREFRRVNIGIGINTGPCCVGNFGSMQRLDYSAIGDDVNVTSRLENLTKLYGLPAVIGEGTMAKCPVYQSLELDFIQVKGRTKPTRIYTLPVLLDDDAKVARLRASHDGFLAAYRAQRWDEAEAAIAQCRGIGVARLDAYYSLFMTRIGTLRYAGLPADWDGAYALTEK